MTEVALRTESAGQQGAPAALVAWADAASAAHRLAAPLVATDFVPAHFRPKGSSEEALRAAQASATAAVLCGAEVGLSPMQSLQGIFVIGGRPGMYARVMHALTLTAGHETWTEESTDTRAIVCGRRKGSQHTERVVVTMDQARKAGWTSNKKYQTEPATMLLARAQSQLCRRIAPDALLGLAYSVEELEDEQPAPTTTVSRADSPKRTMKRAAVAPPPPADDPPLDDEPQAMPAAEPAAEPITAAQLKKLHAAMGDRGLSDRAAGLDYLSQILGRQVETSKELSKDEASRVIDLLENGVVDEPPIDVEVEDPDEPDWPEVARPPDAR
jgi:hypothetical protein